ncbi:hypothetical protein OQA88_13137 [Cercophora sp. LCS_1]
MSSPPTQTPRRRLRIDTDSSYGHTTDSTGSRRSLRIARTRGADLVPSTDPPSPATERNSDEEDLKPAAKMSQSDSAFRSLPPTQKDLIREDAANNYLSVPISPKCWDEDYDENWTKEDEDALVKEWRDNPLHNAATDYPRRTELVPLWRDCHRYWDCSPFDIISPDLGLQVDMQDPIEEDGPDPRWTEEFCMKLHALLFHPFFARNKWVLAIVLQFAVICRTNDCRVWRPKFESKTPSFWTLNASDLFAFRQIVEAVMDTNLISPGLPIPLIHQRWAKHYVLGSLPTLSAVFTRLGELAWSQDVSGGVHGDLSFYKIGELDLTNVASALDRVLLSAVPMFRPTDEYLQLSWAALNLRHGYPPIQDENFPILVSNALLAQLRKVRREEKTSPRRIRFRRGRYEGHGDGKFTFSTADALLFDTESEERGEKKRVSFDPKVKVWTFSEEDKLL